MVSALLVSMSLLGPITIQHGFGGGRRQPSPVFQPHHDHHDHYHLFYVDRNYLWRKSIYDQRARDQQLGNQMQLERYRRQLDWEYENSKLEQQTWRENEKERQLRADEAEAKRWERKKARAERFRRFRKTGEW